MLLLLAPVHSSVTEPLSCCSKCRENDLGQLPFTIPANEDIFRLREEEKHNAESTKRLMATQRVHEKTTFTSRMQAMHVDHSKYSLRCV